VFWWRGRSVVHLRRLGVAVTVAVGGCRAVRVQAWFSAEALESILLAQIRLWRLHWSSHGDAALKGRVVAVAWVVRVRPVAVATVRAIRVYGVARLLKAVNWVHAVRGGIAVVHVLALSAVPPGVGLHAVAVSHALRRTADGSAHAAALVVAVAVALVAVIALARIAVLVGSSAVVAAPPAGVSAHDFCLVSAHRLRAAPVFAIDGGFERLDGVEWALPSRACGVGEIRVNCGVLAAGVTWWCDRCDILISLPWVSLCWNERRD
jgi:hypothetical protein